MRHIAVPREVTFALWDLPGTVLGDLHYMGVYSWDLKSPKTPEWVELKAACEIRSVQEPERFRRALEVMEEWENKARRSGVVSPVAPGTELPTSGSR